MFNLYGASGTCLQHFSPLSGGTPVNIPGTAGGKPLLPVVITASVGLNGANRPADVKAIQRALNFVTVADGGPAVPLKVDGISGQKTRDAIKDFQLLHLGPVVTDQLVEPLRRTIKAINTVLQKAFRPLTLAEVAVAMGLDPAQVQAFNTQAFGFARRWLLDASIRLHLFGGKIDPLAEKYFALSRQPLAHGTVKSQIERMKSFVDRPDVEKFFQPEPLVRLTDTYAWCEAGGFDARPGEIVLVPMPDGLNYPVERNVVYYTTRFVLAASQEAMAYTIVHELAHFCSRVPPVIDFEYQHKAPVDFANMPPHRKVTNADSYAMYAFESGTGRGTSPMVI